MIQHRVVETVNKLVEWHVYLDKSRATRLSQISYVYPPPTQTRDVHKHPEIRSTLFASILLLLYSITSPKPIQSESFLPFFCFRVERNSTFRIYLSIHDVRKHKEDTKKMKRGEYRFSRITLEEFSLRGIFIDEYRRISRYFWNFFVSTFVCVQYSYKSV